VDGRLTAVDTDAPIDTAAGFEAAFRQHFAPVYGFLSRRVGAALAEDLAAEVFATAYRRRSAYHPDRGSLRSWLYGIATNVIRRHWRAEQRLLELDARPESVADIADFSAGAEERVIASTLMPKLAAALAKLNADQRDVLLLFAWAELSHEEIAAAMGISPGTARSRLSRARAALRGQLGRFDFDLWMFEEQGR
jgi:RNA polymerase sigma-70 factor (ECF subfamily)